VNKIIAINVIRSYSLNETCLHQDVLITNTTTFEEYYKKNKR